MTDIEDTSEFSLMSNETNSFTLLALVYQIEIIALPVIIIFGSIFNIMTFIVMRRKRMRVSSTCFYMAVLAVTDTLVLWTGCLNQWFFIIHIPTVVTKSNFSCKVLSFLFVFFADASVWIIVCMSFERFFAVSRPLLASQMCTTKRAKWVLFVMFIIFVLIDGHFLLTLELQIHGDYRACHPKIWAQHFVGKVFVFIDALKYSGVPFCILLILSILIIQRVFRAQDVSAQLQNLSRLHSYRQYSTSSSPNATTTHSSKLAAGTNHSSMSTSNTRVGRRVTFMLLSVSIAFCVFSAPMSLMQIVQSVSRPGYHETPLAIGKAIAELCQYVNHSCNFFLYALTGRIFRREFVRLFFPTRFGSRRDRPGTLGANGIHRKGPSTRVNLIPKPAPSSSHHGSSYSLDNHRYDVSLPRSSRHLSTLYPVGYKSERNQQSNLTCRDKSPCLSSNPSPIMQDRLNHVNDARRNTTSRSSLAHFWYLFERKKESRTTRDDSLLFLKVLKSNKRVLSTV